MINNRTTWFLLTLVITSCCGGLRNADAEVYSRLRTWSDSTGRHKVEAVLVRVADDNAYLKKKEGDRVVTLPVARLSEADQAFIRRWKSSNPFLTSSERGISKGSNPLVLVEVKINETNLIQTGTLVRVDKSHGYVALASLPATRSSPRGTVSPPRVYKFSVLSGTDAAGPRTAAELMASHKGRWILKVPKSAVPPLVDFDQEIFLQDKTPVTVVGNFTTLSSFESISLDGEIKRASGDPSSYVEFDSPIRLTIASVFTADGEFVGAIFGDSRRNEPSNRFKLALRKSFAGQADPVVWRSFLNPVSGDISEVTYEVKLIVSDPFDLAKSMSLDVKRGKSFRDRAQPVEESHALQMTRPANPEQLNSVGHLVAPIGESWLIEFTTKNPGMTSEVMYLVTGTIETNTGKSIAITNKSLRYSTRSSTFIDPLNPPKKVSIPGFDGRPLDFPRPKLLPDGSLQLTSEGTKSELPAEKPVFEKLGDFVKVTAAVYKQAEVDGVKISHFVLEGPLDLAKIASPQQLENYETLRHPLKTMDALFSADGKSLYLALEQRIEHVELATMKRLRIMIMPKQVTDITLCKAGLAAASPAEGSVTIFGDDLSPLARLSVPNANLIACHSSTSTAVVMTAPQGIIRRSPEFLVMDLTTGTTHHQVKLVHQYGSKGYPLMFGTNRIAEPFFQFVMGPDGKIYGNGEMLYRYRLQGQDWLIEEISPKLNKIYSPGFDIDNASGKLCRSNWESQTRSATIYSADSFVDGVVKWPIGKEAIAVGFDQGNNRIFVANNDGFELRKLDGTVVKKIAAPLRNSHQNTRERVVSHPNGERFVVIGKLTIEYVDFSVTTP
jgi:hypothetical protein